MARAATVVLDESWHRDETRCLERIKEYRKTRYRVTTVKRFDKLEDAKAAYLNNLTDDAVQRHNEAITDAVGALRERKNVNSKFLK